MVHSESSSTGAEPSDGGQQAVDQRLVEQTKHQIRGLVREIAKLAQSDISQADFFEGFLGRVVSALAAEGGVVWLVGEGERLEMQYQINLRNTRLAD